MYVDGHMTILALVKTPRCLHWWQIIAACIVAPQCKHQQDLAFWGTHGQSCVRRLRQNKNKISGE